jgi:hypothetical protein
MNHGDGRVQNSLPEFKATIVPNAQLKNGSADLVNALVVGPADSQIYDLDRYGAAGLFDGCSYEDYIPAAPPR